MVTTLLWIVALILMLIGVAGTVLPLLPGLTLIWLGALLAAWIDHFERISGWTIALLAVLMIIGWVIDQLAAAVGAKRFGASPLAVTAAFVGAIVGLFMGLVGVLVMPFVGAVLGEYWVQRKTDVALKAGLGTWLGMVFGAAAKVALAMIMVSIVVLALWWR